MLRTRGVENIVIILYDVISNFDTVIWTLFIVLLAAVALLDLISFSSIRNFLTRVVGCIPVFLMGTVIFGSTLNVAHFGYSYTLMEYISVALFLGPLMGTYNFVYFWISAKKRNVSLFVGLLGFCFIFWTIAMLFGIAFMNYAVKYVGYPFVMAAFSLVGIEIPPA